MGKIINTNTIFVFVVIISSFLSWFVAGSYVRRIEGDAIDKAFNEAQGITQLLAADWQAQQTQIGALQRIGAVISQQTLDRTPTDVTMALLRQMMTEAGPEVSQVAAVGADGQPQLLVQ